MKVLKPPFTIDDDANFLTFFLAGSIEMGAAQEWQKQVEAYFADHKSENFEVMLYNPRRDDWDSSWEQSIDNPNFNQQVTWELDHLDAADIVIFYFDPNTKSPVTLMELGLLLGLNVDNANFECYVCCPPGFWRKGNVDILCKRFGVTVYEDLDTMLNEEFPK